MNFGKIYNFKKIGLAKKLNFILNVSLNRASGFNSQIKNKDFGFFHFPIKKSIDFCFF